MVFEKVREIITDVFSCEEADVTMETKFVEDLDADSVDVVEIAYSIEEEFDIERIPDDDLKNITTVGELVSQIEAMIAE